MTQGSKGEQTDREADLEGADASIDLGVDPAEDARIFAALRTLADPREDEIPDAALLARVLAAANDERSTPIAAANDDAARPAAPVLAISAAAHHRAKKRPAMRRTVAVLFAGFGVAATVAYAAQRIFAPSAPPEPPPEPTAIPTTVHHEAPRPRVAPTTTATTTEEAPPEPTTSASAEPSAAPSATSAAPPPTADELLKRAQSLYTAGDTAGATAAYRALLSRYPGSGEARAALISLGQLALRAGRPGEALGHFDRYLAGGGSAALEARVGRIAALRSLGRTSEERAAIEDFLARHGDGVQATRLRARLAEISGP